MKTQRRIILAGLLLATAGTGTAQADTKADRSEIESDYIRTAKAMQRKDTKELFALMTEDATFKETDGSLTTRPQMEKMMKQMFAAMTYTAITPKVTQWVWQDNAALLNVTTKSAGTMKTPDGKTHSVTYVSKSRDKWVRQAAGWRLQQIEAVSETMTVDGKPVAMPAPSPKQ